MTETFHITWNEFSISSTAGREIIRYESGSVDFDRCLIVTGRSGTGKTLFGRCLSGMLPKRLATSGVPFLFRRSVETTDVAMACQDIIYIPQSPASALPSAISCIDFLREVHTWHHAYSVEETFLADSLARVGLDPGSVGQQQASELSGGMAQRFALAIAVIVRPQFLLLDEPSVGLDCESVESQLLLLGSLLRERRFGIAMVTHDERLMEFADAVLHFKVEGRRVRSEVRCQRTPA